MRGIQYMSCFLDSSLKSERTSHRSETRQSQADLQLLDPLCPLLYHGTWKNTDITTLKSHVLSSYPWSYNLWKENKPTEVLFICIYMKEYENILYVYIYKRIQDGMCVSWHRQGAQTPQNHRLNETSIFIFVP